MKAGRLQRTQLQHVARLQDRLLNALAVQVCPVAATPVHQRVSRVLRDDDRMLPGDKRVQQNDVLARRSAQRSGSSLQFDGVLPVCIGIAKSGDVHLAPCRLAGRMSYPAISFLFLLCLELNFCGPSY